MTSPEICRESLAALRGLIEEGAEPEAGLRAHWASCPACRSTVEATADFLRRLEGGGDGTRTLTAETAGSEAVAARVSQEADAIGRWAVWIRIGAAIGVSTVWGVGSYLGSRVKRGLSLEGTAIAVAVGALFVAIFAAATIVVALLIRRLGLTKRLTPGYQLSGVCQGLAERTGTAVWPWRLAFLALLFWGGKGLWLYLVLDLVTPIHPEDRKHLLRFRVERWIGRRRRRGAEAAA